MAFKRHFARVGAAERCTESIFTDHQRQVCDYALVYAEKKNDGDAPYSVSFTATQSGDVIVQLHPHSQLERAVRHERQAQATEPPASASPAAPPAPAAAPPASCGRAETERATRRTRRRRRINRASNIGAITPAFPRTKCTTKSKKNAALIL